MKIYFENYKNTVDWYYENEWSKTTLFEDLYPLPLMATSQVELEIEKSFNNNRDVTETAFRVREIISSYYESIKE
jgi:hypothetical protein